jgi:RNA polymerase sigma factor (sigma-70 family)
MDQPLGQPASRAGDVHQAFDDFYRAEYPEMVRLAHALTGSVEAAEDVVQEAFARVQHRSGIANPGGYLRVTVVNLCRDRDRRRRREQRMLQLIGMVTPLSLEATEVIDILLELPYRQRAVLVLRYWCDWSEAEIADGLHCRPGTVKTLASRGLARMRKEIS